VIPEGDKVVVRATNRCVQDSFFGFSAAGVEQVFTAMFITCCCTTGVASETILRTCCCTTGAFSARTARARSTRCCTAGGAFSL
jgi:hypothetical protein